MKSAADHLRDAIREMKVTQEEINRQIGVLERTLAEIEPGGPAVATTERTRGSGRAIRSIAMELAEGGAEFSLADAVEAVRAEGNVAQYASVSSILSRLSKEGLLEGVRRGIYRLPRKSTEVEPDTSTWRESPTKDPEQRPFVPVAQ